MVPPAENVIWQYWETSGYKPRYIDGLHQLVLKNAGVPVVMVTPENIRTYLPDIEPEIFNIDDVAHRADMIRTRLVMTYGGMWLDSDAVVLADLNGLFGALCEHEFIGFNNDAKLQSSRPYVRVNCFLSRPNGTVISEWVRLQKAKLNETAFSWSEVGARLLNAVCVQHQELVRILPFERICPVPWRQIGDFTAKDDARAEQILRDCPIVMLTNRALQVSRSPLLRLTVEEIAAGDYLLARILREATGTTPNADRAIQW